MKHTLALLISALALAACSPQAFNMDVESRQPSSSGLFLAGKSFAVVYLENGTAADTSFSRRMAEGFASALENDYFGGNEAVGVYSIRKNPEGNYSSLDTLARLVMDTESDVVFLFDTVDFGGFSFGEPVPAAGVHPYYSVVRMPFSMKLYVYDSMSKDDRVHDFSGTNVVAPQVLHDGMATHDELAEKVWQYVGINAARVGSQASRKFLSEWKRESVPVIYYNTASWDAATDYALDFRWREAIAQWMKLAASSKDLQKRACASYNVALGCYMLGDDVLALKWLDAADKAQRLSVSGELRARIEKKQ